MNIGRIVFSCVTPVVLSLTALSAPALAQVHVPSAFERAILAELDGPTRADIERRATGGNTVIGAVSTSLLNNYYKAGARRPGQGLSVIAVDFSRGVVVFRRGPNAFETQRFDTRTLRILR